MCLTLKKTGLVAATALCLGMQLAIAQAPPAAAPVPYIAPYYQESWKEFLAMKAKAKPAQLPDWSGIWRRDLFRQQPGWGAAADETPQQRGIASMVARLTPKYKAAYDKKLANTAKGNEFDRLSACLPTGMPRWLAEPFMREFIVTPKVTWLIHEQISEIRRVYTDGKEHSPKGEVGPLWEGESIGFWDGDTLVTHTINMKAGDYQRNLPDYSFQVSTVERMRSVGPNTIEIDITVYDPQSLTKPYKSKFTYVRITDRPNLRINLASCEEGNNAVMTPEGGTTFLLPGEPGYHDPQSYGIPEVAMDSLPE